MNFPVPCSPYGFDCDVDVAMLILWVSFYLVLVAAIGAVVVLTLGWIAKRFEGIWWEPL
jgi:hypothetical protein